MPLVSGAEVVLAAAKAGRGVGAFNVIQLEHATALARSSRSGSGRWQLRRPLRCRSSYTWITRWTGTWSRRRSRSDSPR